MQIAFYAARIQALVSQEVERLEAAYETYPDSTMFWCFIDLVGSSNYRIVHGPREGYVRGESFFTLVRGVIAPVSSIRLIKEMGDAVFLAAPSFRPLLEAVLLCDQVAYQLTGVAGTSDFPFGIRAGIGFGVAKRLMRTHDDFLGSSIDQLSRVMSVRSDKSNILVHEDAYTPSAEIIEEYADFLSVSEVSRVSSSSAKGMLKNVFYRELYVDRSRFSSYRSNFAQWDPSRSSATD